MFYFEEKENIQLYKSSLLDDENIVHSFTTRIGGDTPLPLATFSMGSAQNPELLPQVEENRQKICTVLNLDYNKLILPEQKHTDNIKIITSEKDDVSNCDALITNIPENVLMLLFADCVPVIIYAPDKHVLSVVHAGWRGTAELIVPKTLEVMQKSFDINVKKVKIVIGAAIGSCCYPVSSEVAEKLRYTIAQQNDCDNIFTRNKEDNNLVNVDLKKLNKVQANEFGVNQIDVSSACTSCNNSIFYSYRAENGQTGRHAAIASLK
jgi:YfiH family protein